mmetsp:Transcript_20791/g.60761  ORF Transcript_20791/g.60761 Transcript_20791/m.60761 type:complete len:211 (+) Transcript_20791:649-1281(+)
MHQLLGSSLPTIRSAFGGMRISAPSTQRSPCGGFPWGGCGKSQRPRTGSGLAMPSTGSKPQSSCSRPSLIPLSMPRARQDSVEAHPVQPVSSCPEPTMSWYSRPRRSGTLSSLQPWRGSKHPCKDRIQTQSMGKYRSCRGPDRSSASRATPSLCSRKPVGRKRSSQTPPFWLVALRSSALACLKTRGARSSDSLSSGQGQPQPQRSVWRC